MLDSNNLLSIGLPPDRLGISASPPVNDALLTHARAEQSARAVSLPGAGGSGAQEPWFPAYKEAHAKSYNRGCKARFCLWARCQREERLTCSSYLAATAEYQRLRADGFIVVADIHKAQKVSSSADEYREFLHDLGKGGNYKGFGNEAENCGAWGLLKECENGHRMLKRLVCGREWCPSCGEDDSEFHHRRMSRLADRVFSMDSVGYFVFEARLCQRSSFKDAEALRDARRYLHRLLRREGIWIAKGVSRWHYYGEARVNEFSGELDYTHYNPHLNVLCDSGYISLGKLKRIRRLWSKWLASYCGTPAGTAPVHYEFSRTSEKKWHWIRYITRPTFKKLNDTNRYIASDLFGFNNCSWFGTFSEADKVRGRERLEAWLKTLPELERHDVAAVAAHDAFHTGLCPICGAPTRDIEGVQKFIAADVVYDYGGGLYQVRSP